MVNYENSVIYKLCCTDPTIKEVYVGSTTNLRRSKNQHKECCTNEHSKKYEYPVNTFIRDNGGWDNWDMVRYRLHKSTATICRSCTQLNAGMLKTSVLR